MNTRSENRVVAVIGVIVLLVGMPAYAETDLSATLAMTGKQVTHFLEQFSDVKCTEQVEQSRLTKHGKVEYQEVSTFDYLVIAQNTDDDVDLQESRLELNHAEHKKNTPLLVTNGFATLELIFHPSYQRSFVFNNTGTEIVDGKQLVKIEFRHVKGGKSPTALLLRGREFPLELMGTAWVEPQTGIIHRLSASLAESMSDLGLQKLDTEVRYSALKVGGSSETYWFPIEAMVEVETAHQHWRNLHRFTKYQQFSVSTQESVKPQ